MTPRPAPGEYPALAASRRIIDTFIGTPDLGLGLIERWSEPHRSYHTLRHLDACLGAAAAVSTSTLTLDAHLAIWFHDAIYDASSATNEHDSAALAEAMLGPHLEGSSVGEISRLIMLTAGHAVEPGDQVGAVVVDADLSIVGQPAPVYQEYASGIRAEYAHLDDDAFRTGRIMFLESMLSRTQLFLTEIGRARWDAPARENMSDELARLSRP